MVIAVVGAGGKTTRVHTLSRQFRSLGKSVLVTTTTHMMKEPGCVIGDQEEVIWNQICADGYCMAGTEAEEGKIGPLSQEVFDSLCEKVDIVIVEADGSKGMPIKAPLEYEPVIPEQCDRIEVVVGLSAIGKPLGATAHRMDRVMELTGLQESDVLTAENVLEILRKGYLFPLQRSFPRCDILVRPGQINTLYEVALAEVLREEDVYR